MNEYNNYRNVKEPKEVKRNDERKNGIMKIVDAFTQMLENSSEISHDSAKKKMKNFTSWLNGTVDGVTDLMFTEDNYMAYDKQEREMKELETKKNEE